MGGGGVMRAAAKAAGMGVFTGGFRSGDAIRKAVRPSSSGVVSPSSEQIGSLKIEQTEVQRPVWVTDDWEFADGSDDELFVDRNGPVTPRMVFGPVPTFDEAKEATSELKDALDKVYFSSPKSSESVNSSLSLQQDKACITYDSSVPNSAVQAFKLLKESPVAQTVVASIASDPNVWNAVMQNPELLEFLQSEEKDPKVEVHEDAESFASSDEDGKPDGFKNFFEDVKNSVLEMVSNLTDFIQGLFEPNAGKNTESSEGIPKAMFTGGTFLALATMVIMVVVMKRV